MARTDQITLSLVTLDSIIDAIVRNQFRGVQVTLVDDGEQIFIRDHNDMLIDKIKKPTYEQTKEAAGG